MSVQPSVILQAKKARPFFGRHPWVYQGAIERVVGDPEPGSQVRVLTFDKEFIAHGLYNPESNIRVRLYSWDHGKPLDAELLDERIAKAVRARHEHLGLGDRRGACRLIYSESDGLSGLIADRYGEYLVVQFNSKALRTWEAHIVESLIKHVQPKAIFRRVDKAISALEHDDVADGCVHGMLPTEPFTVTDGGLEWWVDLHSGQKTGLFLDQRDNRRALCQYSAGRTVLDVCCYGGGFGITAMKHGAARSFVGVDSSGPAILLAQRNADLNEVSGEYINEQAIPAMQQLLRENRRFGLVVCDPPKFAKKAGDLEQASKGYELLNRLALELLEPGGILCTCSCSGHVTQPIFLGILAEASQRAGKPLQILEQRGQAADHPVSAYCLETAYLKCVIARAAEW